MSRTSDLEPSRRPSGDWYSWNFSRVVDVIRSKVPADVDARALAAVFEHYGRRATEDAGSRAIRRELLAYLDERWPRNADGTLRILFDDRSELPRELDLADELLLRLDRARGGAWPIYEAAAPFEDATDERKDGSHAVTLQVERGLAYSPDRRAGITDESMLLVLFVTVFVGTSVGATTDTEAVRAFVALRDVLGFSPLALPSARSQQSRARKLIAKQLEPHPPFAKHALVSNFTRAATACYRQRGRVLEDSHSVFLPRRPSRRT
jgi:hypothetical protein